MSWVEAVDDEGVHPLPAPRGEGEGFHFAAAQNRWMRLQASSSTEFAVA
jgi:hypothetical protein